MLKKIVLNEQVGEHMDSANTMNRTPTLSINILQIGKCNESEGRISSSIDC